MKKTRIKPKSFTPTMGAYSHGFSVELTDVTLIFVTGQMAMNYQGDVVSESIEEQTHFVFRNIGKILEESGASFDDVVKAQIFLTDINDFPKVSPIRNKYFCNTKPASTLVEVSALAKDGCKIEIEAIAITPNK